MTPIGTRTHHKTRSYINLKIVALSFTWKAAVPTYNNLNLVIKRVMDDVDNGAVYSRKNAQSWKCDNCLRRFDLTALSKNKRPQKCTENVSPKWSPRRLPRSVVISKVVITRRGHRGQLIAGAQAARGRGSGSLLVVLSYNLT